MKRRLIIHDEACYHVISRITERRFYLQTSQKEMFRNMLIRSAQFSGLEVLTYCILDNHFHILVRVPEKIKINDAELLQRIKNLYRGEALELALAELGWCQATGREAMLQALRERYWARMYDLSQFMKTLKQRFSIWYNRNHDRKGTLWEGDRFTSVLVEGARADAGGGSRALLIMSAYIDLNAVRAGLVDDPKDYRWCGYAETLSARHDVCGNLLYIMRRGYGGTNDISLSQALEEYRVRLYLGNDGEKGFDREAAKKVLDLGGRLTEGELLRCRVKYFSAGAVIGEKQFVDNMIQTGQDYFGINRKSGAQKMRGGDWQNLCSGRNLQQDVIS